MENYRYAMCTVGGKIVENLEFGIGGYSEGHSQINIKWTADGYVAVFEDRRHRMDENRAKNEGPKVLSENDLITLRNGLEASNALRWGSRYTNRSILDGQGWSFEIRNCK